MSVKLPVELIVKTINIDEIWPCYHVDEVLEYCKACHNYNANYSCPVIEYDTKDYFECYPYLTLILTKVKSDVLDKRWDEIKDNKYVSKVYQLHMQKDLSEDNDIMNALAMYLFNEIKDKMSEELLRLEAHYVDTLSIPPGSCTRCEPCIKALGKPCVFPEKVRPSFEALGFLVSEIYEKLFGIELEWSHDHLPKAYHSCSGLLSKVKLREEEIEGLLKERDMEIILKEK